MFSVLGPNNSVVSEAPLLIAVNSKDSLIKKIGKSAFSYFERLEMRLEEIAVKIGSFSERTITALYSANKREVESILKKIEKIEERHNRWIKNYGDFVRSVIPSKLDHEEDYEALKRSLAQAKKRELVEKIGSTALEGFVVKTKDEKSKKGYLEALLEVEKRLKNYLPDVQAMFSRVKTHEEVAAFLKFTPEDLDTYFSCYKSNDPLITVEFLQEVWEGLALRKAPRDIHHSLRDIATRMQWTTKMIQKQEQMTPFLKEILKDWISWEHFLLKLEKLNLYRKNPVGGFEQEMGSLEQELRNVPESYFTICSEVASGFRKNQDTERFLNRLLELVASKNLSPKDSLEKKMIFFELSELWKGQQRQMLNPCEEDVKEAKLQVLAQSFKELFSPFFNKHRELERALKNTNGAERVTLEAQKEVIESIFQGKEKLLALANIKISDREIPKEQIERFSLVITQTISKDIPFKLEDIYVYPLGFLGREEKGASLIPQDGKWVVVDLRGYKEKEEGALGKLFNAEKLADLIKDKEPGQIIRFKYEEDQFIEDKNGSIRIFYESPQEVLKAENRDFGQRVRLVEKGGKISRTIKSAKETRQRWTDDRILTAAVLRLQANWIVRTLFEAIVEGKEIDLNAYQHASSFLSAVQANDLATLEGSYGRDPVFNQALHMFGEIEQPLIDQIKERMALNVLLEDLTRKDEDKKLNKNQAILALTEIYKILKSWKADVTDSLKFANENPRYSQPFIKYTELVRDIEAPLQGLLESLESLRRYEKYVKTEFTLEDQANVDRVLESVLKNLPNYLRELKAISLAVSVTESSPSLREKREEIFESLDQEKILPFRASLREACSRGFQTLSRVELILKEVVKMMSKESPFKKKVLEAYTAAKQASADQEILREREVRKLQGNALEIYFPKS